MKKTAKMNADAKRPCGNRLSYDELVKPSESDALMFENICHSVAQNGIAPNAGQHSSDFTGIGTLGEKALHAVLKEYYRRGRDTEVAIGKYVADIAGDGEIVEIQTGSFTPLRPKLEEYLKDYTVTVVYPIPYIKKVSWIDTETGDITPGRKSPKHGTSADAFLELCRIREHLTNPNFRLILTFVDLTEYRYLNGWSRDKKRGSVRCDRLPTAISGEMLFSSTEDYLRLLPPTLHDTFTSRELSRALGIRYGTRRLSAATGVLRTVGAITACGKDGNAIIYERASAYNKAAKNGEE